MSYFSFSAEKYFPLGISRNLSGGGGPGAGANVPGRPGAGANVP